VQKESRGWRRGILIALFLGILLFVQPGQCGRLSPRPVPGDHQTAQIRLKELEGSLRLFEWDIGRYPTMEEGLLALANKPENLTSWRGPYLQKKELLTDPWRRPYLYRCPGQYEEYDLFSYGRDGNKGGQGDEADVTNWAR
jgi:general secretion pathway protein G